MPISGGEKLCPICDSPLQPGSKKCGFCGTDLSIFEIEVEAPKPAPPPAPPKVSMDVKVQEVFSKQAPPEKPPPAPAKEAPSPAVSQPPARPAPAPQPQAAPKTQPAPPAAPAKAPAKEAQETFECPECNSSVPITASTCPKCGVMFAEEGAEMFQCPACNTLVDVEAKSCPGCGALFVEPEEAAAPSQPAKEQAAPSTMAAAAAAIAASTTAAIAAASPPPVTQKTEGMTQSKAAPKTEEKKGFFGMFRAGKKEPEAPAKPVSKPGIREISVPPVAAVAIPTPPPAVPAAVAKPAAEEAPPAKGDKGPELKRMVVEMKPLLALARERDVDIGESKQLIDQGATAGRERELDKAIELVRKSKVVLVSRIDASLAKEISSVNEEIKVAREFGGDVSRVSTYVQESSRAREAGDFEAAYVFLDKAKNELKPITGRYNDCRARIAALKDLIADCEFFVVDTKEARSLMVEATKALEAKDLDKSDALLKSANDKLSKAIPPRMNEELQKAKDALINAKAANVNITPMITVLKSATNYMKNGDYPHALKEMREFKEMMKKAS